MNNIKEKFNVSVVNDNDLAESLEINTFLVKFVKGKKSRQAIKDKISLLVCEISKRSNKNEWYGQRGAV